MHACALEIEIRLPGCQSLKEKRAVLRSVVDGARARFSVAVAEVDHHDLWQRATIGAAAVGATPTQVSEVLDAVERFVWSRPDIEILSAERWWIDR